jgi:hypothetical protein
MDMAEVGAALLIAFVVVGAAIARFLDDAQSQIDALLLRLGVHNTRVRTVFAIVAANLLGWSWGVGSWVFVIALITFVFSLR